MVISGGDKDWEDRLASAFKQRVHFELRDVDKLKLTDAQLYKRISEWILEWHYTPKLTNLTSINFRPDELPAADDWLIPPEPPGNRAWLT